MMAKVMKRRMLRQNTITLSQYSHQPFYGELCRRIETIPVPMHTENHLIDQQGGVNESGETYEE